MAIGRQEGDQPSIWVATQTLARSPGRAFYEKLNQADAAAALAGQGTRTTGGRVRQSATHPG